MKAVLYGLLIGATLALPFAVLGVTGGIVILAALPAVFEIWQMYAAHKQYEAKETAWREATRNSANEKILLQK